MQTSQRNSGIVSMFLTSRKLNVSSEEHDMQYKLEKRYGKVWRPHGSNHGYFFVIITPWKKIRNLKKYLSQRHSVHGRDCSPSLSWHTLPICAVSVAYSVGIFSWILVCLKTQKRKKIMFSVQYRIPTMEPSIFQSNQDTEIFFPIESGITFEDHSLVATCAFSFPRIFF